MSKLIAMCKRLGPSFRITTIDGCDSIYLDLDGGWGIEIFPSYYHGWDIHMMIGNRPIASRYDVPAEDVAREVEWMVICRPAYK